MRVAIIGGGMTGLSLAYYLSNDKVSIDIYETDSTVGGLAGSFKYQNLNIDKFYHHFYTHDSDLIELINELGLQSSLIWKTTQTGMFYADRLHKLSSPLDLIRFKPLSVLERIKIGFLAWSSQSLKEFGDLEKISAKDWIVSKAGLKVYRIMWEPLLCGKFGAYADKISAAWLWSKFAKRGGSRTISGREKLGYLRGGLSVLTQKFTSELTKKGVSIKTGIPAAKLIIDRNTATGIVLSSGQEIRGYDLIISTLSTELTAKLLGNPCHAFSETLSKTLYLANITLILILKKKFSRFYWINVNNPQCPFVGVIEHTQLADIEDHKNLTIIYISKYLSRKDEFFYMEKDAILNQYLPWLKRISPEFNSKNIVDSIVWREIYTQPVIKVGYQNTIPQVETPIRNFQLVTMAQIYPDDRQISNSVKNSHLFAKKLLANLK